jgi:hypothetical protein
MYANGGFPPGCGRLEQIPATQSTDDLKKKQTETMLQAHEALCEAAPENLSRLKTFSTS